MKGEGRVGTWGQFHQHVYVQLLRAQISKVKKEIQVISVFWRFGDLSVQKLLVER